MSHQYAFEVALFAVVRVEADTESEALSKIEGELSCVTPEELQQVRLTEFSLSTEFVQPRCFEIDEIEVE